MKHKLSRDTKALSILISTDSLLYLYRSSYLNQPSMPIGTTLCTYSPRFLYSQCQWWWLQLVFLLLYLNGWRIVQICP